MQNCQSVASAYGFPILTFESLSHFVVVITTDLRKFGVSDERDRLVERKRELETILDEIVDAIHKVGFTDWSNSLPRNSSVSQRERNTTENEKKRAVRLL